MDADWIESRFSSHLRLACLSTRRLDLAKKRNRYMPFGHDLRCNIFGTIKVAHY